MRVERIDIEGFDEVYRLHDPDGFVALHDLRSGHAFGGTRIRRYDSPDDALADALALARAMSLKCAVNDLPGGGGKAVLMADRLGNRREGLARYGEFVESLGGKFVTGPDLGLAPDELVLLQGLSRHIVHEDLSYHAALGLVHCIRGALETLTGNHSVASRSIAVQGLGAVGVGAARLLVADRARVVASDIDPVRARAAGTELGLDLVDPGELLECDVDVVSPCAVGGVLTAANANKLQTNIVCGAANNILDSPATAEVLHDHGVTFVPDFIASSGGAIHGVLSYVHGAADHIAEIRKLEERTSELLRAAHDAGQSPLAVALERWAKRPKSR